MKQRMAEIDEVLKRARQRAREKGLPYEGALLPAEAMTVLQHDPGARLVDVRTRAELDYVGRVPGSIEIEWKAYPGMVPNPQFLAQLAAVVPQDSIVMFLCRSGGRSHDTATLAAQAGYRDAYNVLEGFEGDRDARGHRNTVGGWRYHGLPWVQS